MHFPYSLYLPWLPRHFIGGLVKSVGGALIGGAASFFGGERRNSAAQASSREQMAFQREMSDTAHRRQVKDLRKAGLNPILSAQYGGASTPAGSMYNPQDTLTPAINTGMQLATAQSTIGLQNSQITLQSAQTAVSDIDAKLKQNLIPASQALSEVAEVGLNLIKSIKDRVDTSEGAITFALEESTKFVGETIDFIKNNEAIKQGASLLTKSPIMDIYNQWKDDPSGVVDYLKSMPDEYLEEVKTFLETLRNNNFQE